MNSSLQCFAFSFPFFTGTKSELARMSLAPIEEGSGAKLVVTTNIDHVVSLEQNPLFRRAYQLAWQRTVDGAPIYVYLRLRCSNIRERVSGADLFPLLMAGMKPAKHRPFFVCGTKETAARLTSHLVEKNGFLDSAVQTSVPPYGFESNAEFSRQLIDQIVAHETTHLFLGVGAPKSEIWVYQHAQELGDRYIFGFGAGLDFFAGTAKRAPSLFRKCGLEWMWRFAAEPKRLFRRYFIRSWRFLAIAAQDWASRGKPFMID